MNLENCKPALFWQGGGYTGQVLLRDLRPCQDYQVVWNGAIARGCRPEPVAPPEPVKVELPVYRPGRPRPRQPKEPRAPFGPMESLVLQALDRPMTVAEVMALTKLKRRAAQQALSRLIHKGAVVNPWGNRGRSMVRYQRVRPEGRLQEARA